MTQPSQLSRLIFSDQANNFSEVLASLKRSNLSITNRLRSVTEDSDFVCQVAEAYDLPLIANERCGSWYIPPDRKVESAYFKSTDGHTGQWQFSLRRLNVQVLDVVGKHDGWVGDLNCI
jgi:tRNA A64-2'-O-ribosylphosphate transferase